MERDLLGEVVQEQEEEREAADWEMAAVPEEWPEPEQGLALAENAYARNVELRFLTRQECLAHRQFVLIAELPWLESKRGMI